MKRILFSMFLLLILSACVQQPSPRDPLLCKERVVGNSSLNIILVFHALNESNASYYFDQTKSYIHSVEPFGAIEPNIFEIPAPETLCWAKNDKKIVKSQLECDWTELNKRITACALPNFKMLIITGEDVQTVTVPTYYTPSFSVMYERDFTRYALLHEFGHLFGLQEEATKLRVIAASPAWLARKPNCAENISQAQEWWGKYVGQNDTGFYQGCAGSEEKIRPNNLTLMGGGFQESDYGYVSTQYLTSVVHCCYEQNKETYTCEEFFKNFPEWQACRE